MPEKDLLKIKFWEISDGSLKESKNLIDFCFKENYIIEKKIRTTVEQAEEIGTMLWKALDGIKT